jgi:hypothetical protein
MNDGIKPNSFWSDHVFGDIAATPIVKRKALPKAGRRMTRAESRKHANAKYGEAFRKLAQDERKAKK